MAKELESQIWTALKTVRYSGMSRDIVSFGFVREVQVQDGPEGTEAQILLELSTHNQEAAEAVRAQAEAAALTVDGVQKASARLHVSAPTPSAQNKVAADSQLLPGVQHVIAVASGKGGVGKSTVAANLAVALARNGQRTGLLDADIYGPSLPTLFGLEGRPRVEGKRMHPFERYGVRLMSLGFVVDTDTPVIWRGPMVMRALEQLMGDVLWGELDFLVVDLPPGTGDAQLTLTQRVPLSGAVIVSTPQDVALIDARKGLAMFRKLNVPVVGVIENMSGFRCPCCGEVTDIFKRGGAERTAELLGCPFLGRVPLDPAIMAGGDDGEPLMVSDPDGDNAQVFLRLAEAVRSEVESHKQPTLSIV